MIDITFVREHPEEVLRAAENRGVSLSLDRILELDQKKRALLQGIEERRATMNTASKAIASMSGDEKTSAIQKMQETKQQLKAEEEKLQPLEEELTLLLYTLPNIPFAHVPVGKNEEANVVLREVGERPTFSFPVRDYMSIAEELDIIDTERAAKVAGSRFGYIKGKLALLEWALVLFTQRRLSDASWLSTVIRNAKLDLPETPFLPMVPPVLIRPEIFRAMGKLDPGQEEERYFLQKDSLYLVGSAEHSLGPYYADETLKEADLPIRFIGFSTCFRREAGSYGKDTKGILRVHQFDKLEMFSYAHPERSQNEHRLFLAVQEALMQEMGLPYRVMAICTGDMVWTDAEQFDIETWLPGQRKGAGEYRETHSTSNSTDFQSRRLHTRFRNAKGTTQLVHTINGTAFAIGRALIAIVENYQQADGSVSVPPVLQQFCGFESIARQ